jgi:hypothetical protein
MVEVSSFLARSFDSSAFLLSLHTMIRLLSDQVDQSYKWNLV